MTLYHWVPDPRTCWDDVVVSFSRVEMSKKALEQLASIPEQNAHLQCHPLHTSTRQCAATYQIRFTDPMLQTNLPLGLTEPGATFVNSSPTGSRTCSSVAPLDVTDLVYHNPAVVPLGLTHTANHRLELVKLGLTQYIISPRSSHWASQT